MKFQSLFSGEKKKKDFKTSSAEIFTQHAKLLVLEHSMNLTILIIISCARGKPCISKPCSDCTICPDYTVVQQAALGLDTSDLILP